MLRDGVPLSLHKVIDRCGVTLAFAGVCGAALANPHWFGCHVSDLPFAGPQPKIGVMPFFDVRPPSNGNRSNLRNRPGRYGAPPFGSEGWGVPLGEHVGLRAAGRPPTAWERSDDALEWSPAGGWNAGASGLCRDCLPPPTITPIVAGWLALRQLPLRSAPPCG